MEGCPQTGVSGLAFTQFWVKRCTFTQCFSLRLSPHLPQGCVPLPGGHAGSAQPLWLHAGFPLLCSPLAPWAC